MKRKQLKLILLICLLITACNEQDQSPIQQESDPLITFDATISGKTEPRASGSSWSNDSVGVFMIEATKELSGAYTLAENKIYTTPGTGTFAGASQKEIIYFPEDESEVDFIVYYPYQKELSNYIYPVNVSDQSVQEQIDLLYSRNAKGHSLNNRQISLSFTHQLVKLAFNIHSSSTEETLENLTVIISGMPAKADFNLATGELTVDENSRQNISMKMTYKENGEARAEAILIPMDQLENVVVQFKTATKSYSWKPDGTLQFTKGTSHSYVVNMKGEEITPTPNYGWFETPAVTSIENTMFVQHYLPESDKSHIRNYSLLYDTNYKLAYWVAYPMHSSYIGNSGRTDKWQYDPKINSAWQPNLTRSYPDANLDRGHQIASADRTYSASGNATTFYYSNITAQNSTLNQGIWADLELDIRDKWMLACDTLYVVTGAMVTTTEDKVVEFTKDRDGKDIAKPKYYFKALAQKRGAQYYTIAYKMDNIAIPRNTSYDNYRLTVSELEKETGFIFFPNLPEETKNTISSVWN